MKRKISFLLALILLACTINLPVSAKIESRDKYDILCAFGFFDADVNYSENAPVTRGEIAAALVNSLPQDKILPYENGSTGFDDVTADDADYAKIAYNAKIFGIMGNETKFGAYEKATSYDAAFMILNMLGYGGMVSDSLSYAAEAGLTKGMQVSAEFNMGQLVTILYNALETRVMKFGISGGIKVAERTDGTYLSEILKGGKGRGVVTAETYAAVGGDEPTYEDAVKIGGVRYLTSSKKQTDFIGQKTDYFYRENEDKEKVLVYIKTYDESSVLEIDADSIDNYSALEYSYRTGANLEKNKTASIPVSADIIYNGKAIGAGFDKYVPDNGYVRLIDNNSDGKYEVVVIKDYTTVAVGKINKEERTFSDVYDSSKSYTVDLYAPESTYDIRSADGETKLFTDIFVDNVIFVAQSEDKELTSIIISNASVRGSVDRYSEKEIGINGKVYEPTKEFYQNVQVSVYSYGVFYLDPKGRVGAYKSSLSADSHMGYMIKAVKADESEDAENENPLLFKIYTDSGTMERLYSAKTMYYINSNEINVSGNLPPKVKIDQNTIDTFLSDLNSAKDTSLGGGWVVSYKQNAKGRITELEIAAKYNNNIDIYEKLNVGTRLRQIVPLKDNIIHHTGLFQLDCRIGPDTKVFSIPGDISNENKFECYTGVTNCFAWNKSYTISAFSKQKNGDYVDVVLGYLGGGSGNADDKNVFVVESVSNGLNEDDITIKTIKGIWGTTRSEFKLTEESSEIDIESGDILQLEFDDFGNARISGEEKGIIFDKSKANPAKVGTDRAIFCSFYGYVYDLSGTVLRASVDKPENVTQVEQITKMWADRFIGVYKYNSKNGKIENASYSDVISYKDNSVNYSKIFAWFRYSDHQIMVIYD